MEGGTRKVSVIIILSSQWLKNRNLKKKKQKHWNNLFYKIWGEIKQMACRSKGTGNRGAGCHHCAGDTALSYSSLQSMIWFPRAFWVTLGQSLLRFSNKMLNFSMIRRILLSMCILNTRVIFHTLDTEWLFFIPDIKQW